MPETVPFSRLETRSPGPGMNFDQRSIISGPAWTVLRFPPHSRLTISPLTRIEGK
jgi:hypothetical protein